MILTDGKNKIDIPLLETDINDDDAHQSEIVHYSNLYLSQLQIQDSSLRNQGYSLISIPNAIYKKIIERQEGIPYEKLLSVAA